MNVRHDQLAARAGLAAGSHLVVGCGECSWEAGTDLFLDLVRRTRHRPEVRWAWVGRRTPGFARQLDHDRSLLGSPEVAWVDEAGDLAEWLAAADLLVSTARSDADGSPAIAAAHAGAPTAGFHLGWLARLAEAGAAATVPYPDTAALAQLVIELLDDADRRVSLAAAAAAGPGLGSRPTGGSGS